MTMLIDVLVHVLVPLPVYPIWPHSKADRLEAYPTVHRTIFIRRIGFP